VLSVGAKASLPVLLDGVNLVDLVFAEAVGGEVRCTREACGRYHHSERNDAQLSEGNGEAESRARCGWEGVGICDRGGHLAVREGKPRASGASDACAVSIVRCDRGLQELVAESDRRSERGASVHNHATCSDRHINSRTI